MTNARHCAGEIDLPEAHALIDAIAGKGAPVTFQTFPERPDAVVRPSLKHGTLERHAGSLGAANRSGAGVFLTVNETNLHGRKASDVIRVRAVFADFDGVPLPNSFPLDPHVIVESSPGKWHVYWCCSIPKERFRGTQLAVAQQFDSDRAVIDLPRVLRLPGFWHLKGAPFKTRIHKLSGDDAYRDEQIFAAFPATEVAARQADNMILPGSRNTTLFGLVQLWHRQGRDHDFIWAQLRRTNARLCSPPLDDDELLGLVSRVTAIPRRDKVLRPLAFMDRPEYLALTHSARSLLVEAERFAQLQGNGNISLTPSALIPRGYSANTIKAGIKTLIAARLIERTREPNYGRQGEVKICALYRVCYL